MIELDFAHAIMTLEGSNDITTEGHRPFPCPCISDDDRQEWPNIQCPLYTRVCGAFEIQVKMMRKCKDGVSPSSANVHQDMPPTRQVPIRTPLIEVKDVQEDICRERFNGEAWGIKLVCTVLQISGYS
jgi:hypothetical protein